MSFQPISTFVDPVKNTSSRLPKEIYITEGYRSSTGESFISITIPEKIMDTCRMKKGDRVNINYDPDTVRWEISANIKGKYIIGGCHISGVIKFKYLEGMPVPIQPKGSHQKKIISADKTEAHVGSIIISKPDGDVV